MNRGTVALLVVALITCYGAGVLYFYSYTTAEDGAFSQRTQQEGKLAAQVQVLGAERDVQKHTIDELQKELQQTRAEALSEMAAIDTAMEKVHVDRDRLNVLKAGGAPQRSGDAAPPIMLEPGHYSGRDSVPPPPPPVILEPPPPPASSSLAPPSCWLPSQPRSSDTRPPRLCECTLTQLT